MSGPLGVRITRIEDRLMSRTCKTCYGHPIQVTGLDDDGETVNGLRFPDDQCPDCGRACRAHGIAIVMPFADFWEPEPFNWIRGR